MRQISVGKGGGDDIKLFRYSAVEARFTGKEISLLCMCEWMNVCTVCVCDMVVFGGRGGRRR